MANSTLKQKLANNEMVLCGGVWDSLSAIIEEKAGFDAVKLGSSQLNASLGLPDLGLVTAAEVRDRIYNISNHIQIPLIVDFESGSVSYTHLFAHTKKPAYAGFLQITRVDR